MPGHRHHPLDAGAARRPDARRRGDRGLRLRSARRLPGCHAPGPSGLDQPGIPERRSLDESCHGLPSQRPDGLVKHFYFPGFTPATGGLLREPGLSAERDALQASPEQQESVLRALGVPQHALSRRRDGARLVSLFCYPNAPVDALASALAADPRPTVLLAPEGVAPGLETACAAPGRPPWSGCPSSASRTSTACCGAPT